MKSSYTTISSESSQHYPPSIWSSLITGSPSSPPFVTAPASPSSSAALRSPATQFAFPQLQNNTIIVQLAANLDTGCAPPSSPAPTAQLSLHKRSTKGSSLSTSSSDFEFDSTCLSEINDDPPASPRLICPSTPSDYWGGLSNNGRLEGINSPQRRNPLIPPPPPPPHTAPAIKPAQQSSAASSTSVRQLMAEDLSGDHKCCDIDFYSSPSAPQQKPDLQQKKRGQLVKQPISQDNPSLRGVVNNEKRKWAFKDLLRRTVPSSRADPHHHNHATRKLESPRQTTASSVISSPNPQYLVSGLSKSAPITPAASPPGSPVAAARLTGRPSHHRSPMFPNLIHYKQQKAH